MNMKQIMDAINSPQAKMIMNSKNPQQMALDMLRNSPNANTEMGRNIIGMLERGDMKAVQQYGENMLRGQGINPDQFKNHR